MADPVASIEKIVKLGLAIKDAVDTVRHNEEECNEIRRRVLRFSAILTQLQQTGMMRDSPALSGALEDLEETLEGALELVRACHERSTIRRLITAGELSKQLRRVKDDILNKVMLASFAINAHTTILLLTIQAGAGGLPPLRQPEDTGVELSHNSHSRSEQTGDENNVLPASEAPFVALRVISLSEVEAATNHFSRDNLIGKGAFSTVYKGILNDGNAVAIKKFLELRAFSWPSSYDIHLLISKLQHKNIVKIVGYVSHEVWSPFLVRLLKRREDRVIETKYYWVEEFVPNGSLDKIIIAEPRLHWRTLFRIIEGVAKGINCLHEGGIIHRDIKPSNILLDFDMNPKIADFGISMRISNDDVKTTDILAGTMSYISPEYMLSGIVTTKNDVHAFGITLIETVGSIRRSKPRNKELFASHGWAWEAWEGGGGIEELFDPALFEESQLTEIKRCLQVGLLCTQMDRDERPAMVDVLQMLSGIKELPDPKEPPFM